MDQGLAVVLAATIPSTVSAVTAVVLHRLSRDIKREVATLNESTMGQLAAAEETRRVGHIPQQDRTAREQRHVDHAPPDPG